MSGPAATRLKIKSHSGWFAAAANWQAGLQRLSDGAVCVCQEPASKTRRWAPSLGVFWSSTCDNMSPP